MKAHRAVTFILLSFLLVASFACCPGEKLPPGVTVDGIVEEAIAAGADLDTCQFDLYMTMDVLMTMLGQTVESTIMMYSNGTIDESNEKMHIDMYMNMEAAGEGYMEMSGEMYIIDNWIYMKTEMSGAPPVWMKAPMEVGDWEQQDIALQQIEWLSNAEVKFLKTEAIDGTECYVLQVTPELEKLWALMQGVWGESLEIPPGLNLEDVITDFSVKQWIAKDTYFTRKATQNFSVVLTAGSLGISPEPSGDFDAFADVAITMTIHHINEPVAIELPPEAEEAMELPEL